MSHVDITMTEKREMILERKDFGIAYDESRKEVYVFGGMGEGGNRLSHCEKYSIENNEWTKVK